MAYCTRADLVRAAGGEEQFAPLVDLDGDESDDAGAVDEAIAEADAMINSYVRTRKAVPLNPVPVQVKRLSARLCVYMLRLQHPGIAITEEDTAQYERDITWLRDFAKGMVDLGESEPAEDSGRNEASTSARPSWKAASRDALGKEGGFV